MQMNQLQAVKRIKNHLIITKSADYTILTNTEDLGATFTNGTSLTSEITLTLPAAKVGLFYKFKVESAQNLVITPGLTSDTIALPSSGAQGSANIAIEANAVGESVDLECIVEGDWNVTNHVGTWIAQT